MKTPYTIQSYQNPPVQTAGAEANIAETPQRFVPSTITQPHHPTATEYIIEALGEGIRQNFLGYNIDMEFLTLSARSLAATSISAIRQHIIKPIAARRYRNNDDHSFTPTSC